MTRRDTQTSLALILALGLLLAPGAQAAKEPELAFRPAKSWFVGTSPTTTEASTGSGLVCSVQTEFNNGFIVKLGGSEKWVETLVIDFRQDSFKPGDKYDVALSVPGVKSKTVPASASKSNVLVMDLRGQKDLYHAMRDSAVFDMSLQQNEFRFYLSGFPKAAKDFERCMAGGSAPENTGGDMKQAEATVNESIALEQEEAQKLDMAEIAPEEPKATAQEPEAKEEAIAEAPVADDKTPILMAKQGNSGKRLSEMLAQEIEENPEIADIKIADVHVASVAADDTTQAASKPPAQPVAAVEKIEPAVAPQEITEELPEAPVAAEPAAEKAAQEDTALPPETIERLRNMAAKQLAEPPELAAPPVLDGTAVDEAAATPEIAADAATPDATLPALPAPAIEAQAVPPEATAVTDETAALLEQPAQALPPLEKIDMAPVTDAQTTAARTPITDITEEPVKADEAVAETAAVTPAPEMPQVPPKAVPVIHKTTTKMDADFTNVGNTEPFAGEPASMARGSDPDMNRKIAELEGALGDLKRENAALSDELKTALKESEAEKTGISSENWNLERATTRFNEAERQIRSLGEQIQKERAQCTMEKKDLEAQLFDPQITSEQQLAKLAQMEQELAAAKAKLATMGVAAQ